MNILQSSVDYTLAYESQLHVLDEGTVLCVRGWLGEKGVGGQEGGSGTSLFDQKPLNKSVITGWIQSWF